MIARRLEFSAREDAADGLDGPDSAPCGAAIIVGYGRFGQTIAQMLMGQGCKVTLIDRKPAQIEQSRQFDIKVYYGDGTRIDLLRRAGADQANLIIFAQDDRNFSVAAIQPILEAFPQASVLVRAFDRRHLIEMTDLNLGGSVREVYESAVSMGRIALEKLGLASDQVDEIERLYRENDRKRLDVQIAGGALEAAKDLMYRPGRAMILPEKQMIGDDA